MADFEVTSPDGKKFVVTAPAWASQQDVMRYAQENFPKPEKRFSPIDAIKENPMLLLPQGMAAHGADVLSQQLEHGAYKAGGAATDLASKILPAERTNPLQSLIPTAPEVGQAVNVGIQSIPVAAGAAMGSRLLAPKVENMARGLVRSAIKPPSSLPPQKVEQAISTIIDKGVPTTNAAMQDLGKQTKGIDQRVETLIANSDARVPRSETERHLIDEIRQSGKADVMENDLAKMGTELERYRANRPENMPVQKVHEAKRANYDATGNRPYMQNPDASTAMADKIRMALARGQREATVNAVPETAPLLKEQSDLLNVMKVAGPRLLVEGNRNPASFGAFAQNPGQLMLWLADRDAQTKGALARLLHSSAQGKVPTAAGGISGSLLAKQLGLGKPE